MKKVIALGLLATSLIVAPTAAFAGDSQYQKNDQYNELNGAATDGSYNRQDANNVNDQKQVIDKKARRRRYGKRYDRKSYGRRAKQGQDNVQGNVLNGAADYESENVQRGSNYNNQKQRNHRR